PPASRPRSRPAPSAPWSADRSGPRPAAPAGGTPRPARRARPRRGARASPYGLPQRVPHRFRRERNILIRVRRREEARLERRGRQEDPAPPARLEEPAEQLAVRALRILEAADRALREED